MVKHFKGRADYCAFFLLCAYACNDCREIDIKFEEKRLDILIGCYNFNQKNNLLKKEEEILLLRQLIRASSISSKRSKVVEYGEMLLSGALPISRELKADTLRKVGKAYTNLPQSKKAEECLKRSLKIAVGLRNKEMEAAVRCNLGTLYRVLGKYGKAIEHFERGLKISTERFDFIEQGAACGGLGSVYSEIGENKKAQEYLEKALKISENSNDIINMGKFCHDLANVYLCLGEDENALSYYKKALEIAIEVGDKEGEDRACSSLGRFYRRKGDGEKAVYYQEQSLRIAKGQGDIRGEGYSLTNLGNAFRDIGEIGKALDYQKSGLKISEQTGDILGQMRARFSLGWTEYFSNKYHSACTHFCEYLSLSDKLRNSVKQRVQFNMSMAKQDYNTHAVLTMTLLKLRRLKKALLVLDVGRSKALFDLLKLSTNGINKSLLESHATIKWIEEIPSTIDDPTKDSHSEISGNVCRSLQDGTVLLFDFGMLGKILFIWILTPGETFLQCWSPPDGEYARTVLAKLLRYIQNRVTLPNPGLEDERDAVREKNSRMLHELPEELKKANLDAFQMSKEFLFEIQRTKTQKAQPVSKFGKLFAEEETNTEASSRGRDADQKDMKVKSLAEAYDALIAPIEDVLTGSKLVIVPADSLFCLPFSALRDRDGKYLCDRYSIQLTPALHILNFSLSMQMKALGPAVCVGNPDVGTVSFQKKVLDIVPLPGAEKEASECATYFEARPVLGKQATKKNVLEKMKNASVVHIAAHGNMNYGEIFLAPNPKAPSSPTEEHYLLMPEDITKCSLCARLVVLSCCHSGRGEISSEGVAGTARAFLGAGARSVLVALWPLPDKETREFMKLFYQNVCKELSVCVALQQAMKTFKEKNDHIEAWAPLEIFGEDVTITSRDLEEIRRLSRENMINKGRRNNDPISH